MPDELHPVTAVLGPANESYDPKELRRDMQEFSTRQVSGALAPGTSSRIKAFRSSDDSKKRNMGIKSGTQVA